MRNGDFGKMQVLVVKFWVGPFLGNSDVNFADVLARTSGRSGRRTALRPGHVCRADASMLLSLEYTLSTTSHLLGPFLNLSALLRLLEHRHTDKCFSL